MGKKIIISILVLVLAYFGHKYYNSNTPSPVVTTKYGKLQGIVSNTRNGKKFYSYLGIPYAKPPVGEFRFEPPKALNKEDSWEGVRDASAFGSMCLQIELFSKRFTGNEDCLFLNIYKPKDAGQPDKPIPVMVFIHGGAFISGSANRYDGKYFMDEDVILVTINYRLAALGFLNTGDATVQGNMGLKDQVEALKWIQENIRSFDGDPNQVTIFGESAGGASTHLHTISPLSNGLFHRAISQSGSALSHWATFSSPREQAQRFASQLNCPTKDSVKMVECLKKVPPMELVQVHKEVMVPLRDWITLFVPTVEIFPNENSFIPAEPLEMIKKGIVNKVPWITGTNSHEGLFFSAGLFRNETMIERLNKPNGFDDVAGKLLDISPAKEQEKLKQLKSFYIDTNEGATDLEKYSNLFSDRSFIFPSHKSAELQRVHAPVYLYYYTYTRDLSLAHYIFALKGNYHAGLEIGYHVISTWVKTKVLGTPLPQLGVCHADELGALFPVIWDADITPGSKDYQFSVDMIKLWTSFAKNSPLQMQNVKWEPLDPKAKELKYLKLDRNPSLIETPFKSRIALWNKLLNY